MSNFETAPYRLASAINDLATRVLELEAFDNAIFEIKTTTGRPTARGNYHFVINTFDDTVEIYADGAWEDLIGAGGGGYTDEEAQDAVGTILTDTATIDFTYDDATPEITADVIPGGVDHDSLLNFVANEHINHTSVTLTAGAGLTGGGTIAANRTFNIGAGTGITVNADDIQTNDGAIDHDSLLNFVANEHINHTSVTLTAGSHLSGGGDISANRTFDVDDDFLLNTGDQCDGNLIIDQTDQEAFLIRKDADAGDLFIADTTDMQIGIGGTPEYQLHVLQLQDSEGIQIDGYDDNTDMFLRMYIDSGNNAYIYADSDTGIGKLYLQATDDIRFIMGDASGTYRVEFMDSALSIVASIDSDGDATFQSLVFNDGGSTVDIIRDEDDMASDDAAALATQQSIKAYVDSVVASSGASVYTGSYTGDGTRDQGITGVGFQPDFVKIWARPLDGDSRSIYETTTEMMARDGDGLAMVHAAGGGHVYADFRIITLDADGFSVDDGGTDGDPNKNGANYDFIAIKAGSSGANIQASSGGTITLSTGEAALGAEHRRFVIASESGTLDTMDTISGMDSGDLVILIADSGDSILVEHGTGNIQCPYDNDIMLNDSQYIMFYYDGSNYLVVGHVNYMPDTTTTTVNLDSSMDYDDINAIVDAVDHHIPKNHTLIFQFADGTYTTTGQIVFDYFYGDGTLLINGNDTEDEDTLHTNQAVIIDADAGAFDAFLVQHCDCHINIHNIRINHNSNAGYAGLSLVRCTGHIDVGGCYWDGDGTGVSGGNGFEATFCVDLIVHDCYTTNNRTGFTAFNGTYMVSDTNDETGTDPAYGLFASSGGIKRRSTQPTGSIANTITNSGGTID